MLQLSVSQVYLLIMNRLLELWKPKINNLTWDQFKKWHLDDLLCCREKSHMWSWPFVSSEWFGRRRSGCFSHWNALIQAVYVHHSPVKLLSVCSTLIQWWSKWLGGTAEFSRAAVCFLSALCLELQSYTLSPITENMTWFLCTHCRSSAECGWVMAAGPHRQSLHGQVFMPVRVKCQWRCCPGCAAHNGTPLCPLTCSSKEITIRPYQTQMIHLCPHRHLQLTEAWWCNIVVLWRRHKQDHYLSISILYLFVVWALLYWAECITYSKLCPEIVSCTSFTYFCLSFPPASAWSHIQASVGVTGRWAWSGGVALLMTGSFTAMRKPWQFSR